jgi:hypothetical protein
MLSPHSPPRHRSRPLLPPRPLSATAPARASPPRSCSCCYSRSRRSGAATSISSCPSRPPSSWASPSWGPRPLCSPSCRASSISPQADGPTAAAPRGPRHRMCCKTPAGPRISCALCQKCVRALPSAAVRLLCWFSPRLALPQPQSVTAFWRLHPHTLVHVPLQINWPRTRVGSSNRVGWGGEVGAVVWTARAPRPMGAQQLWVLRGAGGRAGRGWHAWQSAGRSNLGGWGPGSRGETNDMDSGTQRRLNGRPGPRATAQQQTTDPLCHSLLRASCLLGSPRSWATIWRSVTLEI